MISERERFMAVVMSGPLLKSDAIIVLAGEDGEDRLKTGIGAMQTGGGQTLVISGGVDDDTRQSAQTLFRKALAMGVAHDRILLDNESMNTREQAVNMVALAQSKGWRRILLVASPYHAPRAFLTFVKALDEAGQTEGIQVVNCPASHLPWFKKPAGGARIRLQMYAGEMAKIALYSTHVATYEAGLKYCEYWEGR